VKSVHAALLVPNDACQVAVGQQLVVDSMKVVCSSIATILVLSCCQGLWAFQAANEPLASKYGSPISCLVGLQRLQASIFDTHSLYVHA